MTDVLDQTDDTPLPHAHTHLHLNIDSDGDVDAMLSLSSRSTCSPHIHPEIISPTSSTCSDWLMHDVDEETSPETIGKHVRSESDAEMVIIHNGDETPRSTHVAVDVRTSPLSPTSFLFSPSDTIGSTPFASPMGRGILKRIPSQSTPLPTPIASPHHGTDTSSITICDSSIPTCDTSIIICDTPTTHVFREMSHKEIIISDGIMTDTIQDKENTTSDINTIPTTSTDINPIPIIPSSTDIPSPIESPIESPRDDSSESCSSESSDDSEEECTTPPSEPETPTGDGVKRMVDVLAITSPSYIPTLTSDPLPTSPVLIDQTITLVDREELRTREDMIQSLQQRKQKMTRNPKRHEYMNRAAYQLAVHNATWNNETFHTKQETHPPRPRSKSISFFNQARLRYYKHGEETHKMYHRSTGSTICQTEICTSINKPKQGILKRTTYIGPIYPLPDDDDTPTRSPRCSSSAPSTRRTSITKSQSFSHSSSHPPSITWNDMDVYDTSNMIPSPRDLSELDADQLIAQEEAEMERMEQHWERSKKRSASDDTRMLSSHRDDTCMSSHHDTGMSSLHQDESLETVVRTSLTVSTETHSPSQTIPSSPFLMSPSHATLISPSSSSSYSSLFSYNPTSSLDHPHVFIPSSSALADDTHSPKHTSPTSHHEDDDYSSSDDEAEHIPNDALHETS